LTELLSTQLWTTQVNGLPIWAVATILATGLLILLLTFGRRSVLILSVLLVTALSSGIAADHLMTRWQLADERRALDARAFELMTRAAAPGSALACPDGIAGEMIEARCEKLLFATPAAAAAAVSYASAQLTLLAAATKYAERAKANYDTVLRPLRRAVESDRFGIVAHLLAARDNCTPADCSAFARLKNSGRLKANHGRPHLRSQHQSLRGQLVDRQRSPGCGCANGRTPNILDIRDVTADGERQLLSLLCLDSCNFDHGY
jgi:hypothetical protein